MRAAWIAVLALVACGALADSNPPVPTPPKIAEVKQTESRPPTQDPSGDQRGTQVFSIVEKNLPAEVDSKKSAKDEKRQEHQSMMNDVYVVTNIGLALITAVIAAFTIGLFVVGRDTAKRQLRAYVFIKSGVIENVVVNVNPKVTFTIKNFGKTPARKLRVSCSFGFGQSFDQLQHSEIKPPNPMGTLAPGAKVQFHDFSLNPISVENAQSFDAGTHSIFVYGEITYIDFTEQQRTTYFRTMHNARVRSLGPNLASCEGGNDSD